MSFNVNQWKGFKNMEPEERSRIASMGGKAAHARGSAHEWTKDEALENARKGGLASAKSRRERMQAKASNSSE